MKKLLVAALAVASLTVLAPAASATCTDSPFGGCLENGLCPVVTGVLPNAQCIE